MGDEPGDPLQSGLGAIRPLQRRQRAHRLAGQLQARLQIGPAHIRHAPRVRPPHALEHISDRVLPMLPLAPAVDAEVPAGPRHFPDQAEGRIPKQADVGRIVDVRLHHERAAATDQRCAKFFPAILCPVLSYKELFCMISSKQAPPARLGLFQQGYAVQGASHIFLIE